MKSKPSIKTKVLSTTRQAKLAKIADTLGKLRAKLAPLIEQDRTLTKRLAQCGYDVVEGIVFDATISSYARRAYHVRATEITRVEIKAKPKKSRNKK